MLTKRVVGFLRPIAKRYFRSEIRDLGRVPAGAALVSNHSGGLTDLPTFAVDFYDRFGYDRRLYTLSHDILSVLDPRYRAGQARGFPIPPLVHARHTASVKHSMEGVTLRADSVKLGCEQHDSRGRK